MLYYICCTMMYYTVPNLYYKVQNLYCMFLISNDCLIQFEIPIKCNWCWKWTPVLTSSEVYIRPQAFANYDSDPYNFSDKPRIPTLRQASDKAEREIMRSKNADRYFEYLTIDGQKLRTILVESLVLHSVLHIPLQYKSQIRTLRYTGVSRLRAFAVISQILFYANRLLSGDRNWWIEPSSCGMKHFYFKIMFS